MISLTVTDSIQKTVDSIPKEQTETVRIFVPKGVYEERVEIDRPNLILEGEDAKETIIRAGFHASEILEDGLRRGTFRSYTMRVNASNVVLKNLTVENISGPRKMAEQALALYADGEKLTVTGCRILSHQDTLFIGPLPQKELQPGGFKGPGEAKERVPLHQYYRECEIAGDIDFIFGSGAAFFENCTVRSISEEALIKDFKDGKTDGLGYICAPSTYENETFGFVFKNCEFVSDLPKESVYLARPWRDYAMCVFLNCTLGEHIKKEGFHDWNKANARKNCFFAEYGSKGPGADGKRADFVKILSCEEAERFSKEVFLKQYGF